MIDQVVDEFLRMSRAAPLIPKRGKPQIEVGGRDELPKLSRRAMPSDVMQFPAGNYGGSYVTLLGRRPIVMSEELGPCLEGIAAQYLANFPAELTFSQQHLGTSLLWGRFDLICGPQGDVRIAEIDDQASFPSILRFVNPVADGYFIGIEKQLECLGRPLRLVEQRDPTDGTAGGYHHLDGAWLPRMKPMDDPQHFTVVARARRQIEGFNALNQAWRQAMS